MLITSCMRSASSSLLQSLCHTTSLQEYNAPRMAGAGEPGRVSGYEFYPSSRACVIPSDMLIDWVCSRDYIIREHLLPLPEHREILMSIEENKRKIVVLKRDWESSFASQMNRSGVCPYGTRSNNKEACRQSFERFREDTDIYFSAKDGFLHVEFDDLTAEPQKYLRQILEYFQLPYDPSKLKLKHIKCGNCRRMDCEDCG